jgi:hypothetical protein
MKTTKLCVVAVLLSASKVWPYDLHTHAKIANRAFQSSNLGSNSVIRDRLGLSTLGGTATEPFRTSVGDVYVDLGTQPRLRFAKAYEASVLADVELSATGLKVEGWLMRGAIREDDGGLLAGLYNSEPADDPNPGGDFNRFCMHFFDPTTIRPTYGRGFSGSCFNETPRFDAAQWALASTDPFAAPPVALNPRRNHFTVIDAREAMWRALTLTDGSGAPVSQFGSRYDTRKAYWATTFRALGDVIHLVQDMAQPQHVRNESHGFVNNAYEAYIDARAKGATSYVIDAVRLTAQRNDLLDLSYGGYGPPRFARYSDYFSTATATGNVVAGKGLADYSNRNFFTPFSNFGNSDYFLPVSVLGSYQQAPAPANALPYSGMTFFYLWGDVTDQVTQQTDLITMTTGSVFDELAKAANPAVTAIYSLNRKNYDDRVNLLVPRAVGYSTGVIDYFFRGQMRITLPDEGVYSLVDHAVPSGNDPATGGFRTLKLKIQNLTPSTAGGQGEIEAMDAANGRLVAVAKFHRNTCYKADLSGEYGPTAVDVNLCRGAQEEIVSSDPVGVPSTINSQPSQVSFSFPTPIPISASDLYLQVVYRGPLGLESDAVVVETKDISEPTYAYNYVTWDQFTYSNYPSVDPGTAKYADWCLQGYPTRADCDQAMGVTFKFKYSPDGSTFPGFDPATMPQGTWLNTNLEPTPPTFTPLGTMVSPTGKLTRVAVLMDVNPTSTGLLVQEQVDNFHNRGVFQWSSGTPVPAINQMDPATGILTPAVTYISGRGVYLPDGESLRLTSHSNLLFDYDPNDSNNPDRVPPLVLTPSNIAF